MSRSSIPTFTQTMSMFPVTIYWLAFTRRFHAGFQNRSVPTFAQNIVVDILTSEMKRGDLLDKGFVANYIKKNRRLVEGPWTLSLDEMDSEGRTLFERLHL